MNPQLDQHNQMHTNIQIYTHTHAPTSTEHTLRPEESLACAWCRLCLGVVIDSGTRRAAFDLWDEHSCQSAMLLRWANCTGRDAFDGNLTVYCRCGSRDTSAVCKTDASLLWCFDGKFAQAEMPLMATLRYTAGKMRMRWGQNRSLVWCSIQWHICTFAFGGLIMVQCRENVDETRSELALCYFRWQSCLWWPLSSTLQGKVIEERSELALYYFRWQSRLWWPLFSTLQGKVNEIRSELALYYFRWQSRLWWTHHGTLQGLRPGQDKDKDKTCLRSLSGRGLWDHFAVCFLLEAKALSEVSETILQTILQILVCTLGKLEDTGVSCLACQMLRSKVLEV